MGLEEITNMDARFSEPGVGLIFFEYTVGAANAITVVRSKGLAATPFARTGAGVHDVFLGSPAVKLMGWDVNVVQATPGNAAAGSARATLVDAVTNTTTPKVTFTYRRNSDYAATDLADGDRVTGWLAVKTVQVGT